MKKAIGLLCLMLASGCTLGTTSIPQLGSVQPAAAPRATSCTNDPYVANSILGSIAIFPPTGNKPLGSFNTPYYGGSRTSWLLAVDGSCNVYAESYLGPLWEFSGSTHRLVANISPAAPPVSMIVARNGRLYAALNDPCCSQISVMAPGLRVLKSFPAYNPTSLAFNPSQTNLFVADARSATRESVDRVVAITIATGKTARTITNAVDYPIGVAVDRQNNVYVANSGNRTMTEYNSGALLRTVKLPNDPIKLALDSAGNAYVLIRNQINVYKTNSSQLLRTIPAPGQATFVIDGLNRVYVARYTLANNGSVTEYAPNSTKVLRVLTNVAGPAALALWTL
jgi:hypothetical protein